MANGFIDKARITVRAGNGGNGAVAFHREKYIAAGGPLPTSCRTIFRCRRAMRTLSCSRA